MENEIIDDQNFIDPYGDIQIEYGGFWIRVVATLLDALILLPLVLIATKNTTQYKSIVLAIVFSLLHYLYKPLMEGLQGATIGKNICGLKVVDKNYNVIGLTAAFTRNFHLFINFIFGVALTTMMFLKPGFEKVDSFFEAGEFVQGTPLMAMNTFLGFIILIVIVWVAFDDKKQGLHDKFADTFVVKG